MGDGNKKVNEDVNAAEDGEGKILDEALRHRAVLMIDMDRGQQILCP